MATFLAAGFDLPEPGENAPTFNDIAVSTHRGSIRSVASVGVARGFDDGAYKPRQSVDRAQMATFIAKAAGLL